MSLEEVAPGDWDAAVPDDTYLSREYAETAALLDPGELLLLHAEGTVFPCIVRELDGTHDVTGLYGFGGPVGDSPRFYELYEDWCRERGLVTTFTWFHPRFQNQRYSRFHVEPRGGTVAWRLDEGDLFERLHRHHRRAVRKAEAAPVETRITVAPPDLSGFASLYERTMAEKDATGFYYFPAEYWEALAGREWLVLFEAIGDHGVTAALLGLACKPWLHYHLGASERSRRREQPALPARRRVGPRRGLRALPPRRRGRRRRRLAAPVQAPLRRRRIARVRGREGYP